MIDFCESVEKHFQFLQTKYSFELEFSETEDWGGHVLYLNKTTGIKLLYEFTSAFVFVFVYELVNGKLVDNPDTIYNTSKIHCFDFNDSLPESEKMKPAYQYDASSNYFHEENGMSNYTKEFAIRLEKYGKDLLRGNFEILPRIEVIIKARAMDES